MKTSRKRSPKQGAGRCLQTSAYPEFYADIRIRPAPERFFETWIDLLGGFLFSVVLPIPIYATVAPFAAGIGATEQTILATAKAVGIAFPPAVLARADHVLD